MNFRACVLIALLLLPHLAAAQRTEWHMVHRTPNSLIKAVDAFDRMHAVVLGRTEMTPTLFLSMTSDGGATWREVVVDQYTEVPLHHAQLPRHVSYPTADVAVVTGDSGTLFRTTDGGTTFVRRSVTQGVLSHVTMRDGRRGYAGHYGGLLYTDDCWDTWSAVKAPDSLGPSIGSIILLRHGSVLYLAYDGETKRTRLVLLDSLHAIRWVRPWPANAYRMSMSPDGTLAAAGYRVVDASTGLSAGIVYLSRDTGATWTRSLDTVAYPGYGFTMVDVVDSQFCVAAGPLGGVWSTTNGGATWSPDTAMFVLGSRISFADIECFDDRSCLGAMGMDAIFQRVPTSSAVHDRAAPPSAFLQARPNPATSTMAVTINRAVPRGAKIELVDVLGRVTWPDAITLRSAERTEWYITVSSLPAGVYMLRIVGASDVPGIGVLID